MKKLLIIAALGTASFIYGAVATVQELQTREKEDYDMLIDHWIDKEGKVRVGGDKKDAQFSFDEQFLKRRTVEQIDTAIKTATGGFTADQQNAFQKAIEPFIKDLKEVRSKLKMEHNNLDTEAERLARILGKTKDDVLKLPDQSLTNLITRLSTLEEDPKKRLSAEKTQEAKLALQTIKQLRSGFAIQTTAAKAETGEETAEKKAKTSAKTAALAEAVVKSETKLSSLIKASAQIAQQTPCQDIHFDIVPGDAPGSILFLRLVK
jgi:hypothetical protein